MSRTRDLPSVTALGERLAAAAPPQRELSLVHGDFHSQNVIVAPDGEDVRAILDWELCTLGDPVADVGTLIAYWPDADGVAALADAYAAATGRDLTSLPYWHALALWKIAIIGEGVRRRALEHATNAPAAGTVSAQFVEDMIGRAVRVAEEAGL
jgi:aminoglycoside phosphotransferase (APT) family kinase protein